MKTQKTKVIILLALFSFLIVGGGLILFSQRSLFKKSMPEEKLSEEKTILKIGDMKFASLALVAHEKGFFQEENIEVVLEPIFRPDLLVEGLVREEIDAAQIPYTVLFSLQNANPGKFKIISGTVETEEFPYSFLIVKDHINSPKDLKGQKIVTRQGYNAKVQAESILKGMKVNPKEITLVQVEMPLIIPAYSKPEIAAFLGLEPAATIILTKKLGKLLDSSLRAKYIVSPYPSTAFVLNAQFAAQNPELAWRVKKVLDKALEFLEANEIEARKIFQKYMEVEDEIAEQMNLSKFEKLEAIDKDAISQIIKFELDHGILEKEPDFSSVYLKN